MKKVILLMGFGLFALLVMTSCSSINQTMREPASAVKFTKSDFVLSEQLSAEARSVKIIEIDWARLFRKKSGAVIQDQSSNITISDIPVIGSFLSFSDRTKGYALYNLMNQNEGYDVVFYPQYTTKVVRPILGIGFILNITTVKATARLGRLKDDSNSPVERNRREVPQEVGRSFERNQNTTSTRTRENIAPERKTNAREEYNAAPEESKSNQVSTATVSTATVVKANKAEGNAEVSAINQPSTPAGGEKAFNDYVEKNRRSLASDADCSNQHGKVVLSFSINSQGRPNDIYVLRSLCPAADREAFRLLQNGPDWALSNKVTRVEVSF